MARDTAIGSNSVKNANVLSEAFRATRTGFFTAIVFSLFINILAFVGPLYMLQIYDRVITSRNLMTLAALTVIAAFLLLIYASLEKIRSAVLVRLGILFSTLARSRLFDAVLKGSLLQPNGGHTQALRDLDTLREFLTGTGLISFCDAPWVPIFVVGCFILHPWYGYIATGGAVLIFCSAVANELLTRKDLRAAALNSIVANSYVSATFRNAEVLHAMGMLPGMRERWLKRQDEGLQFQAAASDRAGHLIAASKFIRAFLQVAILGTGAYLSVEQESTPGAMIAASIIMGRALAPVEMAVANWKGFVAARSAYERILSLFRIVPSDSEKMTLPAPQGNLAVEQVIAVPPGAKGARPTRGLVCPQAGRGSGGVGPQCGREIQLGPRLSRGLASASRESTHRRRRTLTLGARAAWPTHWISAPGRRALLRHDR